MASSKTGSACCPPSALPRYRLFIHKGDPRKHQQSCPQDPGEVSASKRARNNVNLFPRTYGIHMALGKRYGLRPGAIFGRVKGRSVSSSQVNLNYKRRHWIFLFVFCLFGGGGVSHFPKRVEPLVFLIIFSSSFGVSAHI